MNGGLGTGIFAHEYISPIATMGCIGKYFLPVILVILLGDMQTLLQESLVDSVLDCLPQPDSTELKILTIINRAAKVRQRK